MIKRVFLLVLAVSMIGLTTQPSFAQMPEANEVSTSGPRKQLATIIFAGLAGAVLGLSTLSFYGKPQEKLANIAVGFAIGIIVGASYTTYQAATKPYEAFGQLEYENERPEWLEKQTPMLGFNYGWEFE